MLTTKPKVFEKPSGVKDYLPDTVAQLRYIERNVLNCMQRWGYRELITPTLEYYDTVGIQSTTADDKLFKLLDRRGTTVVLRSELTAPIARVVASVMKDHPMPIRLAYHANVFRAIEEEAGQLAEFFQTGVELVGDASADADAEVIALAIASLKAAGVEKFKLSVGHVGFVNGLLRGALPDQPEAQQELKDCLLKRNHVGYRQLIRRLTLSDKAKQVLEGILRLRGGREICGEAELLSDDAEAQAAIRHLCHIWEALEVYGVEDYVLMDLTMIGDFSYYTGMTFEAYAEQLGFPVCSGGRYDNLLRQFGRPAPATGFALKTNRILELVAGQLSIEPRRVLIVYDANSRDAAIRRAQSLRENALDGEPLMVETRLVESREEAERMDLGAYEERIDFFDGMEVKPCSRI